MDPAGTNSIYLDGEMIIEHTLYFKQLEILKVYFEIVLIRTKME